MYVAELLYQNLTIALPISSISSRVPYPNCNIEFFNIQETTVSPKHIIIALFASITLVVGAPVPGSEPITQPDPAPQGTTNGCSKFTCP